MKKEWWLHLWNQFEITKLQSVQKVDWKDVGGADLILLLMYRLDFVVNVQAET